MTERHWRSPDKRFTRYTRKSHPTKNLAYRQALTGEYTLIRMRLSHLVAAFHADVKAGRQALRADAPGVLTGATFFADKAIENGLADGIATLQECVDHAFIRASIHS